MEKTFPSLTSPKNEQQQYRGVTLIVLCSCVFGGLLIILSVLLFCRFCFPDQDHTTKEKTVEEGSSPGTRTPSSKSSSVVYRQRSCSSTSTSTIANETSSQRQNSIKSPKTRPSNEPKNSGRISYQHPSSELLPDIPEDNLSWNKRERGSYRSKYSKRSRCDGDQLSPEGNSGEHFSEKNELRSPGLNQWSSSVRVGSKGGRNFRPVLVQRQRCIQLEERRSSDEDSSEDDALQNSEADHRTRSHSFRTDPQGDVVLEVSPSHLKNIHREIPIVVVASPQGGGSSSTKPLHRGYRSYCSLRVTSPGKKRTQRSGGSLDASVGQHQPDLNTYTGLRRSFDSDRRFSWSRCEPYGVPVLEEKDQRVPFSPYSSPGRDQQTSPWLSPREFRRSQSERTAGSPTIEVPVRSESVRGPRGHSGSNYNSSSSQNSHSFRLDPEDFFLRDLRRSPASLDHPIQESYRGASASPTSPRDLRIQPAMSADRYSHWHSESVRRQASLDTGELEEILAERRRNEENRIHLHCDSTTPSDEDTQSNTVRYDDAHPMEQVQCRALWQLRSTLEEEDPEPEEELDFVKMEASSPEYVNNAQTSPEGENQTTTGTSHTTSVESSNSGPQTDSSHNQPQVVPTTSSAPSVTPSTSSFLSSEERRTSYKAILSQRLKHIEARTGPALSSENSFDSAETDWSSTTDVSRAEALTTSIDSTTDSTGESLPHRLHQMKADSGYKSLETTTVVAGGKTLLQKLSTAYDSFEEQKDEKSSVEGDKEEIFIRNRPWRASERRSAKKRRDILKEWKHVSLDAGLAQEAELSADESSGKRSVLARFLRTHRPRSHLRPGQLRLLQRDYSIDEKSDRLFKEFSQNDLPSEGDSQVPRRARLSGRSLPRRLEPNDSSPRSHRRKLSPQDSIEEEEDFWANTDAIRSLDVRRECSRFSLRED